MFCENCGKQLSDTAVFCTKCGAKVTKLQTEAPTVQPAPPEPSHRTNPVQASPTQAGPVQVNSVQAGPVPPVTRPAPSISPAPKESKPQVAATLSQPVQPPKATPSQPSQPYGAAPGSPSQSYGATPGQSPQSHGVTPGKTGSDFTGSDVISYGQYMVMFLLTGIPIVNIVLLIKWGFSDETNPNKRNFSRAMLTFVLITFVFSIFLWNSITESSRMLY